MRTSGKGKIKMIIDYKCYECDYIGEVQEVNKKVICPTCGTINDVWLEGEEPPENHKQKANK